MAGRVRIGKSGFGGRRSAARGPRRVPGDECARGQPFASLVTPACVPDFSLLLLLSSCRSTHGILLPIRGVR